jgi:hypothetical protein
MRSQAEPGNEGNKLTGSSRARADFLSLHTWTVGALTDVVTARSYSVGDHKDLVGTRTDPVSVHTWSVGGLTWKLNAFISGGFCPVERHEGPGPSNQRT